MPPQDLGNTGSFGIGLGDISALKESFARRGMDASILDQVSSASAGGAPPIPEAPPTTNPSVGTPQEAGAALAPEGVSQGAPQPQEPDTDLRIALTALTKFVGDESKLKKDVLTLRGQGVV